MTRQEFSDAITTMLNSYNTQANFGEQASKMEIVLDEYEKSVILTQAQDSIVKSYFDGTLNPQGQGFDDSIRRQVDFSSLINVEELTPFTGETANKFDERGVLFKVPTSVLYVLNEQLIVKEIISLTDDGTIDKELKKLFVVIPINFKEYDRVMSKPYAQPLKKQAWRLFQDEGNNSNYDVVTELIPKEGITQTASYRSVGDTQFIYKLRYIRRPRPIILEDLPNGLQIEGQSTSSDCELNPIIHMDILNKAIELVLATRAGATAQQQSTRQQ